MNKFMMIAAGCAALATAGAALGQQAGEGLRAACRADFQKLCADAPAGGGGRLKCLEDNKDKLSGDCGAAVTAMQSARANMREACAADAQKLCADAGAGGDRLKCMEDNKDKLSDGCKSALAAMPARGGRQGGQAD